MENQIPQRKKYLTLPIFFKVSPMKKLIILAIIIATLIFATIISIFIYKNTRLKYQSQSLNSNANNVEFISLEQLQDTSTWKVTYVDFLRQTYKHPTDWQIDYISFSSPDRFGPDDTEYTNTPNHVGIFVSSYSTDRWFQESKIDRQSLDIAIIENTKDRDIIRFSRPESNGTAIYALWQSTPNNQATVYRTFTREQNLNKILPAFDSIVASRKLISSPLDMGWIKMMESSGSFDTNTVTSDTYNFSFKIPLESKISGSSSQGKDWTHENSFNVIPIIPSPLEKSLHEKVTIKIYSEEDEPYDKTPHTSSEFSKLIQYKEFNINGHRAIRVARQGRNNPIAQTEASLVWTTIFSPNNDHYISIRSQYSNLIQSFINNQTIISENYFENNILPQLTTYNQILSTFQFID